MPGSVPLRQDYSSRELRRLASRSKDANQSRRLLSLAAVLDGMSRADAARIGGRLNSSRRPSLEHNENELQGALRQCDVSYRLIPPETPLSACKVPELKIECARCRRNAPSLQVHKLTRRYGSNITIGDLVRLIAGSGRVRAAWPPVGTARRQRGSLRSTIGQLSIMP